jgi:hypothetical protein
MAESASSRTSRWSAANWHRSAAFGIDHIEGDRRLIEPSDGNPVAGPRQGSASTGTIIPLSPRLRRIGCFEQMARDSQLLSPMRSRILGALLTAADPSSYGGNAVLKPLWANEAMHRAHQTVRLTLMLDSRTPSGKQSAAEADLESRIARGLAETLLLLRVARDTDKLPCSEALRDTVRDLVELFGEAAGVSGISTSIERLELASFKRRALVLMAGHLVVETLLFACRTGRSDQVVVILDEPAPGFGRLAVGFSDQAVPFGPLDGSHGVLDDLASLLESDIMYRADGGRIVAGVEFSIR